MCGLSHSIATSSGQLLPLETRIKIFKMVLEEVKPSAYSRALITLSQTSREWEAAILGAGILWTTVSTTWNFHVIRLFLERSKQAQLHVYGGDDDVNSTSVVTPRDTASLILHEAHRISFLRLVLNHKDWDCLHPLFSNDATSLVQLSLDITSDDIPGRELARDQLPILPETAFGGQCPPRLTHLCLNGCRVSWTSPLLSGLTELCLDRQDRPKYEVFLGVLRNLRTVETLALRRSLPRTAPEDARNVVCLPRLRMLRLVDDEHACKQFLKYVSCDLDTLTISADTRRNIYARSLVRHALARIGKFLQNNPLTGLVAKTDENPQGSTVTFTGHVAAEADELLSGRPAKHVLNLSIWFHARMPLITIGQLLSRWFFRFPLKHVTILQCDFFHNYDSSLWVQVLPRALPNLVHLMLSQYAMDSFITWHSYIWQTKNAVVLPKLQFLYGDWSMMMTLEPDMQAVLEKRKQQGLTTELRPWKQPVA